MHRFLSRITLLVYPLISTSILHLKVYLKDFPMLLKNSSYCMDMSQFISEVPDAIKYSALFFSLTKKTGINAFAH